MILVVATLLLAVVLEVLLIVPPWNVVGSAIVWLETADINSFIETRLSLDGHCPIGMNSMNCKGTNSLGIELVPSKLFNHYFHAYSPIKWLPFIILTYPILLYLLAFLQTDGLPIGKILNR